ncbi:exosome complex exonuclease exoribonuclease [Grosmannia clavigera kw1407]|uniref:Ribosomal RNA-processing protein 44 n=1 Tax=Grosmannia clavigera (strain kw1407 / UAMH 11150) TaxID=655863 RepID=F0XKX1_GROCL|nr:exosome complex exonuclease exoribonuclease [Grosmannia clavigera kw1407]EFX01838.1 exosome complex exonuclease exoribonuclease [Grosmannia clavigera kw1407]
MATLKRSAPDGLFESNISSKTFVRTTRSGKVQKIVREVYLRQDIPCSSQLCQTCLETAPRDASGNVAPFVLKERPAGTKTYPQGHYLVPDTNAFLTGMDLFEHTAAFYDVVVLQVVLEEVRNRSLPLYNRLVGLTRSEEKRFYVFFNEFRLETHVGREAGESINDRNDRAVRRATRWYSDHVAEAAAKSRQTAPAVVMISNDRGNLEKARAEGLVASSLADYVRGLEGETADVLLDMIPEAQDISVAEQADEKKSRRHLYPEYLTLSRMMTGVKSGLLHQGPFSVSPYNYLEGSVRVAGFPKPLLVLGRESINRAVDGDVVVVEVLPRDQWKEPSTKMIDEAALTKNESAETAGEDAEDETTAAAAAADGTASARERKALQEEARRTQKGEAQVEPTARVVGVVRRNWRQFVGHVDQTSVSVSSLSASGGQGRKQETVFVMPMDKKLPKMRLRTRQAGTLAGKRILVAMDAWDRDSRHPVGHLVRALGELETKAAETEALLLEYDVQYRPFPRTVLDCLPAEGHDWRVPADKETAAGWKNREDLRELLVCSIDPEGCQDIDDALHAKRLANGNWQVGVHIADVSHFVQAGSAMDAEASVRGTTVYLVDKRIDMLPMLLGTDLCSLRPRIERFAFSVLWELTDTAEVVDVRFCKSVIRSREAFSYEQAQLRIDDASQQDELTTGMRALLKLSRLLRQRRMDAGALSLSSPEVKVHLESETADPLDANSGTTVEAKALLDTNSLVEEFMLLANTAVAARVYEAFPQTAMLRRHAAPPAASFDELSRQLHVTRGLKLQHDSSRALADSLDACVDNDEPFFNTLVRILATRCMTAAEYFPAGALAQPEFRHYGLATPIYTHFTSPIRRYADLVVHRQLAAAIGFDADGAGVGRHTRGRLAAVCRNINARHRNAQLAGRASIAYYVGQAVRGRETIADGFVLRVFSNGFVVLVPRFGIESPIRLRDLAVPEPAADFDADTYVLQTAMCASGKDGPDGPATVPVTIRLFQKVTVRITDHKDETTGKRSARMTLVQA